MSDEIELPDEVDESEREAWDAWLANGMDADGELFRDNYAGEFLTIEEYVEEMMTDSYEIPDYLEYYIDWSSMARDWQLNGDIWVENTTAGYHIFRNN